MKRFSGFAAFTAVFAVCAAFALWGTWSLDVVPVMPDCQTNFRDWSSSIEGFVRNWVKTGQFVPDDLKVFFASPWVWVELQYVFAAYMAALGMVYFLKGKGLSDLACYGAGLFLAFSGYWFTLFSAGHLGWFRWMTYGVFAFGLIDRALPLSNSTFTSNSKLQLRHWLLLGACVAWGSFYQPDLWLLFAAFTGIYFVYRVWRVFAAKNAENAKMEWAGLAKGVAASAAVFFLIGAPSFYAAKGAAASRDQQIEEGQTVANSEKLDEAEKRWIFVTNWSLPPDEIAEAMFPRINGDTSCVLTQALGAKAGTGVKPYVGAIGRPKDAPQGNYRQHSLYIGFITCVLAIIGSLRGLRSLRSLRGLEGLEGGDIIFFSVSAVVFFAFACGRYFEPVYRLVYMLPFGDYLRAPVKWYHLFEFCVVVLAGFGLEQLYRFLDSKYRRLALPVVLAIILIGVFDIVRVDHKFCAPVDMGAAKAKNADMQMTFLPKQQFNHPQVAQMVQAGLIKSLAYYPGNRDVYLVGILKPRGPKQRSPMPPWTLPTGLGLVSLITTFAVLGFAVFCRKEDAKNAKVG